MVEVGVYLQPEQAVRVVRVVVVVVVVMVRVALMAAQRVRLQRAVTAAQILVVAVEEVLDCHR